ncbi:hypothetical protein EDD86DRAFT_204578 [Gorgonomyces haynaldii]|nr:hypothetical protein EDD86DRAFT_204578 [Gorgonomyces haynaldii]
MGNQLRPEERMNPSQEARNQRRRQARVNPMSSNDQRRLLRRERREQQDANEQELPIDTPVPAVEEGQAENRRGFVLYLIAPVLANEQADIMSLALPVLHHLIMSMGQQDEMDYEFLSRLDDIFGPVIPSNADQRDIDAQIPILNFSHDPDKRKIKTTTEYVDEENAFVPLCLDDLLSDTICKCNICLQDYEDDEPLRILKCRHGFHQQCLDNWLVTSKNSCPLCRQECTKRTHIAPQPQEGRRIVMLLNRRPPPS